MNVEIYREDTMSAVARLQEFFYKERQMSFSSVTESFHSKQTILVRTDFDVVFSAMVGENVVGYVAGSFFEREWHNIQKVACVDELYVISSMRKQGVGQKLISNFEKYAVESRCGGIIVHTDFENIVAKSLYTRLGMTPTTVEFWKKL